MSIKVEENTVCEACGCAGEIGFIIQEGDDVAEVTIQANDKATLEVEVAKYVEAAKAACANVQYNISEITEDTREISVQFKFEVSAEKLIFELKCRSLTR